MRHVLRPTIKLTMLDHVHCVNHRIEETLSLTEFRSRIARLQSSLGSLSQSHRAVGMSEGGAWLTAFKSACEADEVLVRWSARMAEGVVILGRCDINTVQQRNEEMRWIARIIIEAETSLFTRFDAQP